MLRVHEFWVSWVSRLRNYVVLKPTAREHQWYGCCDCKHECILGKVKLEDSWEAICSCMVRDLCRFVSGNINQLTWWRTGWVGSRCKLNVRLSRSMHRQREPIKHIANLSILSSQLHQQMLSDLQQPFQNLSNSVCNGRVIMVNLNSCFVVVPEVQLCQHGVNTVSAVFFSH